MRYLLRTASIIAISLLGSTPGYSQQTDGWPEWLQTAMAAENEQLQTAQFELDAGPYQFTLPQDSSTANAFDGGWYYESQIGSDSILECYLFTGDTSLATLTQTLVDLSIQATAEANGGGAVDNRSIHALDAGHIDGAPYLAVEWIYTIGEAPNALIGYTKTRAATNGAITQACTHTGMGFSATVKTAFETFVRETQQPAPDDVPYYQEVILQKLGEQPIGTITMDYTLDADGDTRIDTITAMLMPIGPDALASTDNTVISWSSPNGMLINAVESALENGELKTDLEFFRNEDSDWVVNGTFQGKPLQHIIDREQEPVSELGSMQIARDFLAGDATEVSIPSWVSEVDPTQIINAKLQRAPDAAANAALLVIGPLTMATTFDASGSMKTGRMQIGAAELIAERVWQRGEIE